MLRPLYLKKTMNILGGPQLEEDNYRRKTTRDVFGDVVDNYSNIISLHAQYSGLEADMKIT